jgi:hypothetical protein
MHDYVVVTAPRELTEVRAALSTNSIVNLARNTHQSRMKKIQSPLLTECKVALLLL